MQAPFQYLANITIGLSCVVTLAFMPGSVDQAVKKVKLTVKDFPGKPDDKSPYLASTNPVLSYEYAVAGSCAGKSQVSLEVNTRVYISKSSWMKLNMIRNQEVINELLSHEQGHFDIWEVFAIDLKQALTSRCFDKGSYKLQVDSIYRVMNRKYDSLQRRYDRETQNMFNKDKQVEWKRRIEAMR